MSFNAGAITGSIGLDTHPLDHAVRHTQGSLSGMKSHSDGVFSGIAGGFKMLLGPVGVAIAGVASVGAVIGGLTFGGKLVAEAEQAQVAFGVMMGSADQAKTLIGDLNQFAASTPFEMPGITEAARKLLAFGSSGDQVIPELRAIGDISAGIGAPISEIAELYGKARVQGRLMAEDINQLTGRGIPIIGELAKQFGVAESEVKGLVSEGKVGFSNLQQAFVSMTGEGGQFAGLMAAQSQTLGGLISTLRDNVGMLARDLTADLFDRIDLKGLIADFTEAIPVIKGVLGGVLDLALNGIGELAHMLGIGGDAAENSGNMIVSAMEVGARRVAFVADMVDAAIYGYDLLRLGAMKFMSIAASGIAELANLAAELPEWLGGGLASNVAEFADLFAANLDEEISKLQSDIDAKLLAPSRGERVMAFFAGVRKSAEATANATSDIIPDIEIAPETTTGAGDKLLGDLQSQLDGLGLSDIEQKFADIRSKGLLNEDELVEARRLLEAIDDKTRVQDLLESIESPFDQFQEQMAELEGFLAKGLINQQQFDELSEKKSKEFFGGDKLAGLNFVGSNEELQLQAKQRLAATDFSGASDAKDVTRKQIDEQKETNKKLDNLAGLLRQISDNDAPLTIPVV